MSEAKYKTWKQTMMVKKQEAKLITKWTRSLFDYLKMTTLIISKKKTKWLCSQSNWTNIFLQSQGGNINIAELVTRLKSNTGPVLANWLRSIPKYPKAFKVKMRPLNELLNFNVRSLFIGEFNQTCQRTQMRKCSYGTSVEEFQESFDKRRKSLEYAIEMYRHKVLRRADF